MDDKHDQLLIWAVAILIFMVVFCLLNWKDKPDDDGEFIVFTVTETARTESTVTTSYVPDKGIYSTHTTTVTSTGRTSGEMTSVPDHNLNTASAEDLKRVSGVGDVLAERIVAYRTACGGFCRRAELNNIEGIGPVLAERIMEEFFIPNELPSETEPEVQEPEPLPSDEPVMQETEPLPEAECYELNHVTREELLLIPGMTEQLADEILTLRTNLGSFQNVYELLYAEHMNGNYFEHTLREYIYLDPPESEP